MCTALGIRGGVTNAVALTESIDNQAFTPWRVIASAPDVAAQLPLGTSSATFDKPSVDLTTVPFLDGAAQIAAAVMVLRRVTNAAESPVRFDIALSTAVSFSPNESAADQSWTTRVLNLGGNVLPLEVTNPIVKISHDGAGNLFVAYQSQAFDQAHVGQDGGGREWNIVRTTVDGASQSSVFAASSQINIMWSWTSGDAPRAMRDVEPMSFDIARRQVGTHLWITYAEKSEMDGQHVVVADCDDHPAHRCAPESEWWRYKTIHGLHGGELLQPSVVADQGGQSVSLIFYENRGTTVGLEPEGMIGNLATDGTMTWTTPVPLTGGVTLGASQDLTYLPCPLGNQFGDYIGSTRLPIANLTISAWADSRRGCISPGNDLHVQATLW